MDVDLDCADPPELKVLTEDLNFALKRVLKYLEDHHHELKDDGDCEDKGGYHNITYCDHS
jgi:hypothetical protein